MTLDKLAAAFACALLDKGGHFAAWEQPQIFATEVRAGFRSLR
jgi:pimeloyl-ACP methyl ester carboxylesterase